MLCFPVKTKRVPRSTIEKQMSKLPSLEDDEAVIQFQRKSLDALSFSLLFQMSRQRRNFCLHEVFHFREKLKANYGGKKGELGGGKREERASFFFFSKDLDSKGKKTFR